MHPVWMLSLSVANGILGMTLVFTGLCKCEVYCILFTRQDVQIGFISCTKSKLLVKCSLLTNEFVPVTL